MRLPQWLTLQQKIDLLRRMIESGKGRTNKPISEKRLALMQRTLDEMEKKERGKGKAR